MARRKHPDKEIEDAIAYAENYGWRVEESSGHPWGQMYCPKNDKECWCGEFCRSSIWSTPRNSSNHAQQIRRVVSRCINKGKDGGHGGE